MRILITGSTGFIGRNLAEELAGKGHQLFCLVRKTSKSDHLRRLGCELVYGDVTDAKSLTALPGCDVIFHCAAKVEDRNLPELIRCNAGGTENICEAALERGVKRLIYLSSVAVVSGNQQERLTEDLPYQATNLYGISKVEAEKKALEYRAKGLPVAILRPCMVYGEGEPHALDRLLTLVKYRLFPLVDGGRRATHLVYVKNVVAALIMAMEREEFLRDTFFVADNDVLTAAETFGILAAAVGGSPPLRLSPSFSRLLTRVPFVGKRFAFFTKDRIYDTSRLRAVGYDERLDARAALRRTGEWWLERKKERAI